MAPPTLVQYTETDWDASSSSKATGSISWNAGDLIICITLEEGTAQTLNNPTATGLTFTSDTQIGGGGSQCNARYAEAIASGSGSSAVTVTETPGNSVFGAAVWVFRDWQGARTRTSLISSSNASDNFTRVGNNSRVVLGKADFTAAGVSGSFTPGTATSRQNANHGLPSYTIIIADWPDQGSAGTTAYGKTTNPGTPAFDGFIVEIQGIPGSPAPLPSRPPGLQSPQAWLSPMPERPASVPPPPPDAQPTFSLAAPMQPPGLQSPSAWAKPAIPFGDATVGDAFVFPATVQCTTSIPAPTVSAGSTVTPAVVSAVTTIPAPTVTDEDLGPYPSFPAFAPMQPPGLQSPSAWAKPAIPFGDATVTATGDATVSPATVQCVTTIPAPTVSAGSTVAPAVVSAVTTIPAPTVTGEDLGPYPSFPAFTPLQPPGLQSPSAWAKPAIPFGDATVTASGSATVTPATVQCVTTIPTPSVSAGSSVSPAVVQALTTIAAQTVSAGSTATPGVVSAVASIPGPAVSAGSTVAPAVVAALAVIPLPTVVALGPVNFGTSEVLGTGGPGAQASQTQGPTAAVSGSGGLTHVDGQAAGSSHVEGRKLP